MYLLEETEEARDMRQNIKRLLYSNDEANITLALQTIQGGGFHNEFEACICFMVFAELFYTADLRWRSFYGVKARMTNIDSDSKKVECEFLGKSFGAILRGFSNVKSREVDLGVKLELTAEPITPIKHIEFKTTLADFPNL